MKLLLFLLLLIPSVSAADFAAVSQFGFHPSSHKQVVVYTSDASGTAFVVPNGATVGIYEFELKPPKDYFGNVVACQGGMPCIVGDFSKFNTTGEFFILTGKGVKSDSFAVDRSIFSERLPVFLDFFDAMRQQGSSFHADIHSGYEPPFSLMADGSFIMEAWQAYLPLIRLGSAYRRNPQLLKDSGIEDVISDYAEFLKGLQGIEMEERTDGVGFRLNPAVKIENVFVPGPTNLTELDVYIPGNPPKLLSTVPVVSLCGNSTDCLNHSAKFFKCQADEPCLNLSYIERTGVVSGRSGYGVSLGYGYEFGCYIDIDLDKPLFGGNPNPCMIFYPQQTRELTSGTLLGFLEAYPALNDEKLLKRSIDTAEFIESTYPDFSPGDIDSGYFGASMFLLYDYTGNPVYLSKAHSMRSKVPLIFISDGTRGNEFYWEEYARHKANITGQGLEYLVSGADPAQFFRGKLFFDYKDRGPTSISKAGERVYEFERNISFQNSRYMLTEGVLAAKASYLGASDDFIPVVAQSQLAWLTGMNAVQQGTALDSPVRPMSFIFGIGDYPKQFHSRYLVNTGHFAASSGSVIGARGTDLQFKDGSNFVFMDGVSTILGKTFGSIGNGFRNESKIKPFRTEVKFNNGLDYIPGWINGAFDIISNPSETDVIFNYEDNLDTYEFTETTNEMVATAIELIAYLDASFQTSRAAANSSPGNLSSAPSNLSSTPSILVASTNISSNQSIHPLFETDTAGFFVRLNSSGAVQWKVNGVSMANTTGINHSFAWYPGILFSSGIERANVSANSNTSHSWLVSVEDVINPFFTASDGSPEVQGSSDVGIHVFTNTRALNFSQVNVSLSDGRILQLSPGPIAQDGRVDWSFVVSTQPGDTYLTSIIGSLGNSTLTYSLGSTRAHYHQVASSSQPQPERISTRQGGSGGFVANSTPEVVYAVFGKGVLQPGVSQSLSMDVRVQTGKITAVQARILGPLGDFTRHDLNLSRGSQSYGTWSGLLNVSQIGTYFLDRVEVSLGNDKFNLYPANVSFYSAGSHSALNSSLELVYVTLSGSSVSNGSSVLAVIDASDKLGIKNASLSVRTSKGLMLNYSMRLVKGTEVYGTWHANITANFPDTTYYIESILLSNANSSTMHLVDGRSFYVAALPTATFAQGIIESGKSLGAWSVDQLRKLPFVPTLLGFFLMAALTGVYISYGRRAAPR